MKILILLSVCLLAGCNGTIRLGGGQTGYYNSRSSYTSTVNTTSTMQSSSVNNTTYNSTTTRSSYSSR